jgi:fucose 4-O-acetylase-like acetyltransferase
VIKLEVNSKPLTPRRGVPAPLLGRSEHRDSRSDYFKAGAIVAVVGIHAGLPYSTALRFCVPAFIVIWAFHFERALSRRSPREFLSYVAQRFVRLLVPYMFWTALYLLLFRSAFEWKRMPIHTIIGGALGGYGWPGQYFFVILFQLTLLMPFLRRWVNPRSVWISLAAGLLLNTIAYYLLFSNWVVSGLGDRLFIYWLSYVFMGVAFARGYPRAVPALVIVALISLLAAPSELGEMMITNRRVSPYLLPTVTVGSFALLLALGPRLGAVAAPAHQHDHLLHKAVVFVGQRSLVIFVANPLFVEGALRNSFAPRSALLSGKIALVGIAVVGSLILGGILRRLKLGVLVGR